MRSIKRRFHKTSKRNYFLSSLMCFAESIKDQNFSKQMIHRWFYKLVDENEYDKRDRKMIFEHLENL